MPRKRFSFVSYSPESSPTSFRRILILSVYLAAQSSELPLRAMQLVGKGLLVLWIISLSIAAVRITL
ncbi:MAG: hypothetical protein ABI759_24320 [Candidatus Solibacter sp.]